MLSILFYAALLSATVPYAVAYEHSWIAHMTYLKLCVGHILSKCESCYINDSNAAATHWNLPVIGSSIVLVKALCQVGDNCFQIWLSKRCPFSCNLGYMPEPVGLWGCTSITFPVDTAPPLGHLNPGCSAHYQSTVCLPWVWSSTWQKPPRRTSPNCVFCLVSFSGTLTYPCVQMNTSLAVWLTKGAMKTCCALDDNVPRPQCL